MKALLSKSFNNRYFLIFWCITAAFGAYFCMYAFRKPFTTGLYESYTLFGWRYKSILIILQVIGYMISKFIGIKVISELKASHRIFLIVFLIVTAELALVLFALIPFPYNTLFMLMNGLPLGMVWGVIFSFLEGRRVTEFIALGLSINLIIGSGILKTIYLYLQAWTMNNEFWLPALIGIIFLPIFIFFVWMLAQIPPPDTEDVDARKERIPMSKQQKKDILIEFSWGFWAIVILYVLLTVMRDFRDNFAIEIWKELQISIPKNTFMVSELTIGLFVLGLMLTVGFIRNNDKAFRYIHCLILLGIIACGSITWAFQQGFLNAFTWMIGLGIAFFLPYLLIQTLYFERFIALFRLQANAGFFVYICDSWGYFGSVLLMIYREFFINSLSFLEVLIYLAYVVSLACFILWTISIFFFLRKQQNQLLITKPI